MSDFYNVAGLVGNEKSGQQVFRSDVGHFSVLWKRAEDKKCWSTYDDLKGREIGASPYHCGGGFFEAAEKVKFNLQIVSLESPELIHFKKFRVYIHLRITIRQPGIVLDCHL